MEVIIDDRDEKTDANGRTYIMEVIAYKVPQTEKYPSGTKYSFHANYKNPKELILRYDNANNSHTAKHHKHIKENGKETTKELQNKTQNSLNNYSNNGQKR